MKYVITMPSSQKRIAQFKKEMQRIGWDEVKVIEGVNGEDWLKENEITIQPGTQPRNVGNYLSHIKVLKDAIDNGYDDIIVMEDDLILCQYFPSLYNYAIQEAPEGWEMLRLSWFHRPNLKRGVISKTRLRDTGPRGTEMYRIRGVAIEMMYKFLLKHGPTCPIDRVIHLAPVKSYMTAYSLGMQRDNPVDLMEDYKVVNIDNVKYFIQKGSDVV